MPASGVAQFPLLMFQPSTLKLTLISTVRHCLLKRILAVSQRDAQNPAAPDMSWQTSGPLSRTPSTTNILSGTARYPSVPFADHAPQGTETGTLPEVSPPDTSCYLSCQAFNACYSNNLHLVLHCHRIQTHTGQIKLCHLLGCSYWPAGESLHVLTTGCLQLRATLSFWKTVSCFPLPETTLLKEGRQWRVRSVRQCGSFEGKIIEKMACFWN